MIPIGLVLVGVGVEEPGKSMVRAVLIVCCYVIVLVFEKNIIIVNCYCANNVGEIRTK